MIRFDEILSGTKLTDITEDILSNLYRLHFALNSVRIPFDQPMIVTSGYRTPAKQLQIYTDKNVARAKKKLPPLAVPEQSMHLIGAAADISDPKDELKYFISDHLELMETLHLYFEDFDDTDNWVHCQIYAPHSGARFFKP